jgi:hypothetical protein
MNRAEFKARWESDEDGGGITFDDIADCYISWGLGASPRAKSLVYVRFAVLEAAGTVDAHHYESKKVLRNRRGGAKE